MFRFFFGNNNNNNGRGRRPGRRGGRGFGRPGGRPGGRRPGGFDATNPLVLGGTALAGAAVGAGFSQLLGK